MNKEVRIIALIASVAIVAVAAVLLVQSHHDNQPLETTLWVASRPTSGNARGTIQLVEFGDFQCPSCEAMFPVLKKVLQAEPHVALQYRYFPLPEHKNALQAAKAAEAAAEMNAFWPMHDMLYQNQTNWQNLDAPAETFAKFAVLLGMDESAFNANVASSGTKVQSDIDLGTRIGVSGTPTFFINGRLYDGPLSEDGLEKAIDLLHL